MPVSQPIKSKTSTKKVTFSSDFITERISAHDTDGNLLFDVAGEDFIDAIQEIGVTDDYGSITLSIDPPWADALVIRYKDTDGAYVYGVYSPIHDYWFFSDGTQIDTETLQYTDFKIEVVLRAKAE